ncbi:MAG TPA: NAD(P)H-dependent oxidoreductase [Devosiaceae bacterium]|jgi:NAD(P)H-dependent FMN reductase|nr:NAD(P)H-dependent oxidoreductase [Devosiaceae bacterium]
MSKPKIAVIIGSIRPARFGDKPAKWILEHAQAREDIEAELLDLADFKLPLFDAAASDLYVPPSDPEVIRWHETLNQYDGYIFVTAEYNRSIPGALKNAIDHAYTPFVRKAAAFLGYGSVGGARAVEHLRNVMVEVQAVPVRQGIHIGGSDFMPLMFGQKTWDEVKGNFDAFVPDLLDNLVWWTNATKTARTADEEREAAAA